MVNKYNKEDLYKMNVIDVYNLVLERKHIKIFPAGFWQQPEALNNAKIITQYLIEEKLQWSDKNIKQKLSVNIFKQNSLGGMLLACFNGNHFMALNNAYPNKFKPWELNQVSNGFWANIDNCIDAIKWLIEEKLKWSDEEIKENLTEKVFKDNGLGHMLRHYFNSSEYKAIELVYPGIFKPWDLKHVGQGYWTDINNGINAVKWLIEEKLQLSDNELKEHLSKDLFKQNGLDKMLILLFRNSPYDAINKTYPDKFKPWDFHKVSQCYWQNEDNRKLAIKWLIEENLKLSDDELKQQLNSKLFEDNGLYGLICSYFNRSVYEAINFAYPNKFKKSDFYVYKHLKL